MSAHLSELLLPATGRLKNLFFFFLIFIFFFFGWGFCLWFFVGFFFSARFLPPTRSALLTRLLEGQMELRKVSVHRYIASPAGERVLVAKANAGCSTGSRFYGSYDFFFFFGIICLFSSSMYFLGGY